MTTVDLLGLVLLGMAAAVGLAALAGGLLAFGEERLDGGASRPSRRGSCADLD